MVCEPPYFQISLALRAQKIFQMAENTNRTTNQETIRPYNSAIDGFLFMPNPPQQHPVPRRNTARLQQASSSSTATPPTTNEQDGDTHDFPPPSSSP